MAHITSALDNQSTTTINLILDIQVTTTVTPVDEEQVAVDVNPLKNQKKKVIVSQIPTIDLGDSDVEEEVHSSVLISESK